MAARITGTELAAVNRLADFRLRSALAVLPRRPSAGTPPVNAPDLLVDSLELLGVGQLVVDPLQDLLLGSERDHRIDAYRPPTRNVTGQQRRQRHDRRHGTENRRVARRHTEQRALQYAS